MVEFLLVACLLGVGLLGLGALQVATTRGGGWTRTRMDAAALAGNALEAALAEARLVWRPGAPPESGPSPLVRTYTAPEQTRWVASFSRDCRPLDDPAAGFYRVTVSRAEPVSPPRPDAPATAHAFQATVAWTEESAAAPVPGRLDLHRVITY